MCVCVFMRVFLHVQPEVFQHVSKTWESLFLLLMTLWAYISSDCIRLTRVLSLHADVSLRADVPA